MARTGKNLSITQKNDASCIGCSRKKARRAKTNSNKRDRRLLRKELYKEVSLDLTEFNYLIDGIQ